MIWGLGHLTLGDRRGWLLLVAQPIALAAAAVAVSQLIDGTRWLAVFPVIGLIVGVWFTQAVHAHRLAVERGHSPGGELRMMMLLALSVVVLTGYWLFGGRHGSPSATLGAYLEAWRSGRAEDAAALLVGDPPPDQLRAAWSERDQHLREAVAAAAVAYGREAGLDPDRPFDSLRFTEAPGPSTPGTATINVDLVRLQRVESSVLGLIPTARQQTVVVERQLVVRMVLVRQRGLAFLPAGVLESFSWEISTIDPA